MARFANPGRIERRQWERWVAEQPPVIRQVVERIDPWTLYRLRSTGQRGTFRGLYLGNGIQVAVDVGPAFNLVLAGTAPVVFTSLDGLEPCSLPQPGERVGVLDVQPRPDGWITEH